MYIIFFTKNTELARQIDATINIRNFSSKVVWDIVNDDKEIYNLTENYAIHSIYIDSSIGTDNTIMLTSYILKTSPFSNICILGSSDHVFFVDQIIKLFKLGIKDFLPATWGLSDLITNIEGTVFTNTDNDFKNLIFIDDLTGLYNTRYLNFKLEKELKRSLNKNLCFSILFIDIDNFKYVNDSYGHIIASTVLNLVGRFIKENTKETDLVFRYGGDEFVVMLENTSSELAFKVAERLRKIIENKSFFIKAKNKLRLTVSIGLASFPDDAKTTVEVMEMADQAMYAGKKSTKNVVYTAKKLLYNE